MGAISIHFSCGLKVEWGYFDSRDNRDGHTSIPKFHFEGQQIVNPLKEDCGFGIHCKELILREKGSVLVLTLSRGFPIRASVHESTLLKEPCDQLPHEIQL